MLELREISKRFGSFSLKDVSFTVRQGDYFILLGESGAGKSLVLETIAGLVEPDSGSIFHLGKDITREKIQNRGTGLVFQDHAVFPHMTVAENLSYPLHRFSTGRKEMHAQVSIVATELGISDLLGRKPGTLSGGELQRVALGRTLIQEPAVLLLDEPLASIDTSLRKELRRLLRSIHGRGKTILHVTHDYEEALSLATRIAVIGEGRIIQEGNPLEVLHHPRSEFVARFAGISNFFPARLVRKEGICHAVTGEGLSLRILSEEPEGEGFVLIRGEDILISVTPAETSATNHFQGKVMEIVPSRGGMEVSVDAGFELHALVTPESVAKLQLESGAPCNLYIKAAAVKFITK